MTALEIPCPSCAEPTKDGLLCRRESSRLVHLLRELPDTMRELETNYTRQGQSSTGNGARSSETPLVYDVNSSEVYYTVENTIGTWIRSLMEDYGEPPNAGITMTEWCDWLTQRIYRIRSHVAVAQIVDELTYSVRIARQAIDRQAEREYVCTCAICGAELYAVAGAESVTCKACRRVAARDDNPESETYGEIIGYVPEYDVQAEHLHRLAVLRDQYLTAADVMTAISALHKEQAMNPKTFRSWVNRAKLVPRACDVFDRALLYHVDEALALARRIPTREPTDLSTKRRKIRRRLIEKYIPRIEATK